MMDGIEGVGSETFGTQEEPLELTSEATQEDLQAETGENGTGEAEEVVETDEVEEQPRKGKSVQERIDELYGKAKDAERDAEYWRSIALGKQTEKSPEPEAEAAQRPDPNNYDYGDADPRYQEDLIDWKAEQIVNKRLAEHTESLTVKQQAQALDSAYAEHVAKVREEIPDYDEKVTAAGKQGKWPCSEQLAGLIKSSPVGPKVAYHLATNLSDAVAINELPPIQQAAAFGMIAAQLGSQTAPQAKIATTAPQPAPARTKGGQFAPTNELDDRLSGDEWLRRRNAQLRQKS